jgi:Domain of unknown function (DUF4407)
MSAQRFPEPRSAGSRIEAVLTWLGGGYWRELGERHERSSHAVAGVVVLLDAALAWLVATLAVAGSTRWPTPAVLPLTLVFGLLVGAVTRALASGLTRGWPGIVGRGAIAVAVGVVAGELAALVLFSGSIDRRLDEQAARNADSMPAVMQASADLDRARASRTAIDTAVEQAGGQRDAALVVARCEYNPTPACPQTHITGVPGAGPETHTANEFLADAQTDLDHAVAARDRGAPELDARIADGEQALALARRTAMDNADHGLGARWVAMHDHTFASGGAGLLQLLTIAFFALLSLLPLILKLWLGETTDDRTAAARAERDRAELEADTAIAVKRAQVRAAAETMWADQQLAQARLAVEAQTEIDRAQQRSRVTAALSGPVQAPSQPESAPQAQLAAGGADARVDSSENLPARVESGAVEPRGERGTPLIPAIPDVTRAVARWIRPLVPPFVARAIDTTTQPFRAASQVLFEEVEEITYSLRRSHTVTVNSEQSPERPRQLGSVGTGAARPATSSTGAARPATSSTGAARPATSSTDTAVDPREIESLGPTDRDSQHELREADGPRQLPSAE